MKLLVIFAIGLCSGCITRGSAVATYSAEIAGHWIIVDVISSTAESSYEGSPRYHGPAYYSVYFDAETDMGFLQPTLVRKVGWANEQPIAGSAEHVLRFSRHVPSGE